MRNIIKRVSLLAVVLSLCSLFSLPVKAEETKYSYIIDDQADLLTDYEEQELVSHIEPLLEYGNVIFSTVYLDTSNYEKAAEDTYYAYYKNEPGVHFQIDMSNRKLTLSCSTEMEDRLGKERESIVDNIYTLASNGDYARCAAKCFDQILTVLNDGQIAHTMKYIDNAIIALLVALILNFIFVFAKGTSRVSNRTLVTAALGGLVLSNVNIKKGRLTKVYSPQSSGSGGSGGSSGGGGGGGGFSGGSSSHGF